MVDTMTKRTFGLLILLALCIPLFAQDDAYYKAIQKGSSTPIELKQFKKMEEKALKDYSKPETYEELANVFGNTTERVWGVIYGEVYCNISSDAEKNKDTGAKIFQLYADALTKNGDQLSISLTKNAQMSGTRLPFESQYEINFLMVTAVFKIDPIPMTIQKLSNIRKNLINIWGQKKFPKTELIRRQEAILAAGHFEAYNYWLFRGAQAEEYNDWLKSHKDQYEAWMDWHSKNKFTIEKPDFQRRYLIKNF